MKSAKFKPWKAPRSSSSFSARRAWAWPRSRQKERALVVALLAEALQFLLPERQQFFELGLAIEGGVVLALLDQVHHLEAEMRRALRGPVLPQGLAAVGAQAELEARTVHGALDVEAAGHVDTAAHRVSHDEDACRAHGFLVLAAQRTPAFG
ncbi:hypothetical protein [Variovorax sp. efr-133-TYG-130]|uniref:hypothetical protein n=1 Tax=Variovorax sp. efr-133-TYG-130 TaxID=3040327 RepID=UPI0025572AF9|nr:hypothetical protein [Variovorax sp. efr-133-TYG-130]